MWVFTATTRTTAYSITEEGFIMGLTVTNNVASINAQHNLSRASNGVEKSVEKLSSGLKINRGADGPAALVISEKQRAQIAGLRQAIDNTEKAAAVVQTAEGALNEINSLLVKVRTLAIDSANSGVNDDDALAANQAEITNALDSINRIANNTQFGAKKLLDGSAGIKGTVTDTDVTFLKATTNTASGTYAVVVTTEGERAAATSATDQTSALAADEILTINEVSISLTAGMNQAQVVNRINEFNAQTGVTAEVDGSSTRLYTESFGANSEISAVSNRAASATSSGFGTSVITATGVDVIGTINGTSFTGTGNVLTATSGSVKGLAIQFAADGADAAKTVTGAQGNVTISDNSLVFQIGSNKDQTASISIDKINPNGLGLGVDGNQFNSLNEIDVTSGSKAQDALEVIDAAISNVTNLRGTLGAFQSNTLESTANNLRATLENTINAESVIRDTDFAEEIANFTKGQVLVQAGTAMLSNANQIPQAVLSLLR
ncbi:MAG: flagellin [Planctomycetota bacterium]|nr:MAG: flagellin [Planctomycetota bacterium]